MMAVDHPVRDVVDGIMSRWVVVALVLAGCNSKVDDHQFCMKQQMAWESAFPTVSQTDERRERFIADCLAEMPAKHANGQYERSLACFDKIITYKGHATEEFLAFKKCETATP